VTAQAPQRRPAWAFAVVASSLRHGLLAPHPVSEYSPTCRCAGRIALVADVAHQASPITGAGARLGFDDATILAAALAAGPDLPQALAAYEAARLPAVQAVVAHGQATSAHLRAVG
jgi:2-polyprenyl-6-methoxyphenol hydroxylase-like FAD-dependent oxidoreductase